jgi:hypothetical protein
LSVDVARPAADDEVVGEDQRAEAGRQADGAVVGVGRGQGGAGGRREQEGGAERG